jgi:hypothetical protein
VYENKGPNDKMPDTKGDISTQLDGILHENTGILPKPSALLSLFDRWGTNLSLQNVETRGADLKVGTTASFIKRRKICLYLPNG